MNESIWRNRYTNRSDMAVRLTHLTRGNIRDDDDAFEVLWKILTEKKLIAQNRSSYVKGDNKVCCFQEIPLTALIENLFYEDIVDEKLRYGWFGIRVNKGHFYQRGGRPVIYENSKAAESMFSKSEYWRIVDLELDDANKLVDWMHEREWRIRDDYEFEWKEIEIVLKNNAYYQKFINRCLDEGYEKLLKEINGIVTLDSVYS